MQIPQTPASPGFRYEVPRFLHARLSHDQWRGSFSGSSTCEQARQVALSRGLSSEHIGQGTVGVGEAEAETRGGASDCGRLRFGRVVMLMEGGADSFDGEYCVDFDTDKA